jgi:ornithine carbamoyltransferase
MPNLKNFSKEELIDMIKLGIDIKKNPEKYCNKLKNKTMAMWFEKSSLRTRASFEAGMTQLGGHAIYLDTSTTHKKANIEDEIKCLSKYADIIIARVFEHDTIKQMQEASKVPIINALCDTYHPCQALADIMTLFETLKDPYKATIAYVGDGNNVCNSLIIASKKLGIKINVSTPQNLKPDIVPDFWIKNPVEAVKEADIVYTDTWMSMGEEDKKKEKTAKLKNYQVNKKLIGNKYFMHCLPAIRGQEVTDEVIDSKKSLVFEQAENRLHIQKAIVLKLLDVV